MTTPTPTTDAIMALADAYAFHIPGSQNSDEARAALLAALQAREGEAVIGTKTWMENGVMMMQDLTASDIYAAQQPAQPNLLPFSQIIVPEGFRLSIVDDVATVGLDDPAQPLVYGMQSIHDAITADPSLCEPAQPSEPAQPVALPLTPEELELCRQWFNSIQDTNAEYLEPSDYLLAEKVYKQLNIRVPNSISEITKSGIGGGR